MNKKDFSITLLVDQSPKEAFNAINNVRDWWSGEIEGSSARLNDEFTYHYKEIHFSKQRIVEMIPDQKVVWLVTDSSLNFMENINEWTGTTISFEITKKNGKTELRFSHIGLVPEIECFGACSSAWTQLIQGSLFSLITIGKSEKIDLG